MKNLENNWHSSCKHVTARLQKTSKNAFSQNFFHFLSLQRYHVVDVAGRPRRITLKNLLARVAIV